MKKIFISGMCSLPMGTMERQKGNMGILIPMLDMLRDRVQDSEVVTSLQLSDRFCEDQNIISLKIRSLYEPTLRSGLASLLDYVRSGLWALCKSRMRLDAKWLIGGEKFGQLTSSDIILDFSGDTYGDMAHLKHMVKHSVDLLTFRNLQKPIYMFAQSPGPFSTRVRRLLARYVLNKVSLITARDPRAYTILQSLPVTDAPVIKTGCPAWLLNPAPLERVREIVDAERFAEFKSPLVGLNISGYNVASDFLSNDKYREQRAVSDLVPLVRVLKDVLEGLEANVVVIPHVYRTNSEGAYVPGPDGKISEQLVNLANDSNSNHRGRLMIVKGLYSAAEIKGLIGQCDLFIAGRLHAGVAAMSQGVPTVLLAYGYKHYGYAELVGLEEYVCNNLGGVIDAEDIMAKVRRAWMRRKRIRADMTARMKGIEALARLNAKLVAEMLDLKEDERTHIPPEKASLWATWSELAKHGEFYA